MNNNESWEGQDVLKLSVEEWISLLENPKIFNQKAKELIMYVYIQHDNRSTASDIAMAFNVTTQSITALNRRTAKNIYELYYREAPQNTEGGKRYWNVLFDGIKETPKDRHGHYYWKLRDNLVKAIDMTKEFF